MLIVPARHAADHHHDLTGHIEILVVVILLLRRDGPEASEHQGRLKFPGAGPTGHLEVHSGFKWNDLSLRSMEGQTPTAAQFASAEVGEGLEITASDAARLEAGFLELGRDVVRGLVDALRAGAAPLTLVGGQEGDVAFEPRF